MSTQSQYCYPAQSDQRHHWMRDLYAPGYRCQHCNAKRCGLTPTVQADTVRAKDAQHRSLDGYRDDIRRLADSFSPTSWSIR